ncbi:hypothetical protein D1007_47182 [Hordeum vulgare]|nr:hypothetical protein D1007_47182 [Hordeum vulgare]
MCQAQASVVVNRRRAHVVGLVPGGLRVADPLDRLAKWTDDDDHPCSWLGVNYDTCTGCMTSLSLLAALLPGRLLPCNNLCPPALLLNLIAFGLTVATEQHRSKPTVTPDLAKEYDYCIYDSDVATGYGVGALLLLIAAQVIVMLTSQCFCCGCGLKPGIVLPKSSLSLLRLLTSHLVFFSRSPSAPTIFSRRKGVSEDSRFGARDGFPTGNCGSSKRGFIGVEVEHLDKHQYTQTQHEDRDAGIGRPKSVELEQEHFAHISRFSSGKELDIVIVKATNHIERPSKEKYIRG